ncbi:tetratricopeptide repeat protein [Micromonospora purpureochromogenes]|uniref:tetratricopeptide repeat protein n=1 Tax=Micromonospora purpureochromogenes TaxID=47872 RepID=UPI0033FF5676
MLTLGVVVTQVVALAVNAASDQQAWWWGLDVIRRYPFPSLLVGAVLLVVLSAVALSVQRSRAALTDPSQDGDGAGPGAAVRIEQPRRTGVVDAPVGELPTVVRGRDGVVADLLAPSAAGPSPVRVVTGLGGCGKTTVALAAARAARAEGWRVWWVSAVDGTALVAGMSAVAREAGAPAEEVAAAGSDVALAGLVWRWLARVPGRWLLVIDNADDPAVLAPGGTSVAGGTGWVRPAASGTVVVTSRVTDARVWGHRAGLVPLSELDEGAAALMLLDRMGRAGEAELMPAAVAVADRLGRLPLAVHLAGSYLGSGVAEVGLTAYLDLLAARSVGLVDEGAPGWGTRDPRRQVLSTWEISLDALERQGRVRARTVLRVLSFLAAGSVVPVSMLDLRVLGSAGLLSGGDEGRVELAAALAGLRAVGLVESAPAGTTGGDGVLVHPLVAEVSRVHADRDGRRRAFLAAAARLVVAGDRRLHPADPGDREAWRLLAPHAVALRDVAAQLDADLCAEVVGVNNGLTYHLVARGSYPAAIDHGEHVAATAAQLLGEEHPDTLKARNNLATAYQAAGRLTDAIALSEATLAARERVLGAEHPDALMARNNLAAAYQAAGRLGEAIPLLEATLAARERVLGEDHPATLMSRHNLAYVYKVAGRLGEAIPLLEATLAARERVLGVDHPDTLMSRNNLAAAYRTVGRLGKAVPLFEATLAARERVLGAEHPHTLRSRHNLAYAYQMAGRTGDAIPLMEATLAAFERVVGTEHPETLTSRNNLAGAYDSAGRSGEAVPLYEATLAARERVLGPDHPDTLTSRSNLACAYQAEGRLGEAISLHETTLASRLRVLGEDHPDTQASRHKLALAYRAREEHTHPEGSPRGD